MEQANVIITMTVMQWNVIMNALGQRPFAEVVDIITSIKSQAESQLIAPSSKELAEAE